MSVKRSAIVVVYNGRMVVLVVLNKRNAKYISRAYACLPAYFLIYPPPPLGLCGTLYKHMHTHTHAHITALNGNVTPLS